MNQTTTIRRTQFAISAFAAAIALTALAPATALAQTSTSTAPAATSDDVNRDQTVVMDPFSVSTNTNGYYTENTLIGSRVSENLMDIPKSITIINTQQLQDLAAYNTQLALQYGVPGLSDNGRLSDDYSVRGYRSEYVLTDGITALQTESKPMYDVDRIEVLRGPTAMELGNNNFLGGAVNLITRQPTATPQGVISAVIGNDGYKRVSVNASGPAYSDDELQVEYRVTVGGTDGTPEKAIENQEEQFIGGAVNFIMGKDHKDNLEFVFQYYKNTNYTYPEDFIDIHSYFPGGILALNQYSTRHFVPGYHGEAYNDFWKWIIEGIYHAQLTSHSNLRLYLHDTGIDSRGEDISGTSIMPDNVTLNRQAVAILTYRYQAAAQVDFVNHHDFAIFSNNFDAGIEDDDRKTDQYQQIYNSTSISSNKTTPFPTINVTNPDFSGDAPFLDRTYTAKPNGSDSETRQNVVSGYVQENVSFLNGKVAVIGGLRWIDNRTTSANELAATLSDSSSARNTTHQYGIVVKPVKGISLYYTQGTLFIPLTGFLINGQPEVPQYCIDSEWGIKADYNFNSKISFYGTATHFDMTETNVVVNTIVNGISGNSQNAEDATAGYEFEAGSRLTAGPGYFDLIASYYSAVSNQAGSLLPAADAIPWAYSFLGKYTWTDTPLKGFMFGAGVYAQGNKVELTYAYVHWPATYTLMSAYAVNKNWDVQFNVNNLTNKYYIVQASNTGEVSTSAPRQFQLQARYHW